MARRIGAELLDALDAKLAAGEISQGEYEAKRIGIQERIRKGQDWESSAGERLGRTLLALVALFAMAAFGVWAGTASGSTRGGAAVLALLSLGLGIAAFIIIKPKG